VAILLAVAPDADAGLCPLHRARENREDRADKVSDRQGGARPPPASLRTGSYDESGCRRSVRLCPPSRSQTESGIQDGSLRDRIIFIDRVSANPDGAKQNAPTTGPLWLRVHGLAPREGNDSEVTPTDGVIVKCSETSEGPKRICIADPEQGCGARLRTDRSTRTKYVDVRPCEKPERGQPTGRNWLACCWARIGSRM
jgi:hypothetical protein